MHFVCLCFIIDFVLEHFSYPLRMLYVCIYTNTYMIMTNVLNVHIKLATVTVLFVGNIGLLTAHVAASVLNLLNKLFVCGLTSYRTSLMELQTSYICQFMCSRYVFEVISQGVCVAHIRLSVLAKGVAVCCKKVEWDVRLQGHKHDSLTSVWLSYVLWNSQRLIGNCSA